MPRKTVPVRSHYRDTEHKRVHVNRHTREIERSRPRQHNLEMERIELGPEDYTPEELGLEPEDPEGEACAECGNQRKVYQRDILGRPLCRTCHHRQVGMQMGRNREREDRDKRETRRIANWDKRIARHQRAGAKSSGR